MSLLSVCQDAARVIGGGRIPSAIVGATADNLAQLLLALANEEGRSQMRRYAWQALQSEKVFTTTAADTQAGAVPPDFDRMIPETMFNRTRNRFVAGPMSAADWQRAKSSAITTINPIFRMRGNLILFTPQQTAGETVAFEYVSKNWCESNTGTRQARWLADTDVALLDEDIMALGLIWRFRQRKGLSYAEDLEIYERRLMDAELRDGGRARLSSDPECYDRGATRLQIPDTLIFP